MSDVLLQNLNAEERLVLQIYVTKAMVLSMLPGLGYSHSRRLSSFVPWLFKPGLE